MNSYWFYLEPYVFIFEGFRYYAIYNTLNGVYLKYKKEGVLNDIILKLQQLENGYCVLLNDVDLAISIVENFVFQLRNSFSADLVNIKLSPNKPFVFMPKLNLMENENDMKDQSISGRNVLSNLSEVFIYLNSNCKYECYYCDIAYKQFACCKKSNMSTMGVNECLSVLNKIELAGVSVVNFLGGDVLEYEFLDELLFNLHRFKFKKIFYVYYKSILSEKNNSFFYSHVDEIKVLLPSGVNEKEFVFLFNMLSDYHVSYCFILSSEQDLINIEKLTNNFSVNFECHPFYDGNNKTFFIENVYLKIDDVLESVLSKKDIFRKQILNENFFGRIYINTNGDVYANLNYGKIGNLYNHSLNEIIFNEIARGKSWFFVRNEGRCLTCCNKYLCPSPSNYEIVLNQIDLCELCD